MDANDMPTTVGEMWVKVPDRVVFPYRAALAVISRRDILSVLEIDEPNWNQFLGIDEFSETVVQELLHRKFGAASVHWNIDTVRFDMARQQFDVCVSHPDFPATDPGMTLPYIDVETGLPDSK